MKNKKNAFPKNYFLIIFVGIGITTIFFAISKSFAVPQKHVYAKVKVGQGLWWAQTEQPTTWLTRIFKKGAVEKDLTGKTIAEIIQVRYYPFQTINQFNIYLTVKLAVNENKKNKIFLFKRSQITPGSPINLEFSSAQISATVMAISPQPFIDNTKQKTIILEKPLKNLSEYENIPVGDFYFDGEEEVIKITNKEIVNDFSGQTIYIKAPIQVQESHNQFIFGEDYILLNETPFPFFTNRLNLSGFTISQIEN